MKYPSGFVHPDHRYHVCKLKKAIYGTKLELGSINLALFF